MLKVTRKKVFGQKLREARENSNLSQTELASLIDESMTQAQLSKYERGEAMPRPDRVTKFADALGVSEAWLRGIYTDDEGEETLGLYHSQPSQDVLRLQQAELDWQRKELEAQREILDLRQRLSQQTLLFSELGHALNLHIHRLEAFGNSLAGKQKRDLFGLKEELTDSVPVAPKDEVQVAEQLQATLKELGKFFVTAEG